MEFEEKKLSKFVQAINRDAENRRARILNEAEEFRRKELQKAEDDALEEAYHLIQDEIATMRRRIRHESSMRVMERHRAVLQRREEITEQVFEEAKKRVLAFTETPDYAAYLTECVKEAVSMLGNTPVTVRIRPADGKYESLISSLFPAGCTFHESDEIVLGGLMIECPQRA